MTATAKLFMTGRSQAVRLPKAFRMPGTEVRVSRDGNRVILEPAARNREDLQAIFASIDAHLAGAPFPERTIDWPLEPDTRNFFDP